MAEPQPPRGEPTRMSPETFTQQWGQIRQELRGWWDQLTERDLEQIGGQRDQLVRVLQERYRYTRERAQDEVDRRLQAYQTARSGMAETITTAAQEAAARLTETAETVRSQATEAASTAAAAVDAASAAWARTASAVSVRREAASRAAVVMASAMGLPVV